MKKPTTKQPSKGSNAYLYVGVVLLAGAGVYALNKGKNVTEATNSANIPPQVTTKTPTENLNLILKLGSKGTEVMKLQYLLGVTADGSFGPQTEAKLFSLKGVKAISVNNYSKIPNIVKAVPVIPRTTLPFGSKVMAKLAEGAKIYGALSKADKSLYSSGILKKTVGYGQVVGEIRSGLNVSGYYVVYYNGWNVNTKDVGFVKATEVQKI